MNLQIMIILIIKRAKKCWKLSWKLTNSFVS